MTRLWVDHFERLLTVKSDLMSAPVNPKNLLFFVEKVELELAVSITYETEAGIKVSLWNFLESGVSGKEGQESGHTIKISLTPVIPIEEQRELVNANPQLRSMAERASIGAMWKSVEEHIVGEPE